MENVIEIGTDEQKEQVEKELRIFEIVAEELLCHGGFNGFIITDQFDAVVNSLQGTTGYTSFRNQVAIAKAVSCDRGNYIVVSPFPFSKDFDPQCRILLYLHEILHLAQHYQYPQLLMSGNSYEVHFNNLYILYGEYEANRVSLNIMQNLLENETIFDRRSKWYRRHIARTFNLHLKSLTNCKDKLCFLKKTTDAFRIDGDWDEWFAKTSDVFDEISKDLIYTVSFADAHEKLQKALPLVEQTWVYKNGGGPLVEYLREKYERSNIDLLDGIDIMRQYMERFGYVWEDTAKGLYCRVVDING